MNQKGKLLETSGEADVVEDHSDGELSIASANNSEVSEDWILDSSCTLHMSPNKDRFTTYEIVSEKLKRNLISLSTLDSKGYKYTAESGVLKISKGSLVVMKGQRKTVKLYVLQGSIVTSDAIVASSSFSDDDVTRFRHMRLGYMSENDMTKLSKKGLLDEQGISKLKFCESDHETLDNSSYSTAKQCCRMNEQNNHGGGSTHKAGVKGYKLWCPENRKVVISRDVVFNENAMLPNLSLKDSLNKEQQKQVELQIFLVSITESTPKVSTENKNKVTSSPQYAISKNKIRREINPTKKYAEADLVAYALNMVEDIDGNQEPSTYSKAVSCEDLEKCMFTMQKDMELLHKNRIWDLVKLPKGKKLDVKTTLLHRELEEDIYMLQPEGFTVSKKEDYVCLLKKSLHGLKQSLRQWYKMFDSFITSHDFNPSSFDSYVYFKKNSDSSFVYLLLYVDDMFIVAKDKGKIRKVKAQLSDEFEMKDLEAAKNILGMEILRDRKTSKLYLSQKRYIEKVLYRLNMRSVKPVSTP
ncbi:hypothetical protein CXB51_034680 [Gossypium anomalum]|uniref:Reverse transcriptase Ty1/copia-type domain-containing protein n=1 Tax=Gossypium anomalum TaxID=47600 RepID=A0A8J6CM26_9ROSI|nr:hypothetical protein CXB51_034680 [Gossypium anomalum]